MNPVPLNNVDHQGLRVLTRRDAALGDAVMAAVTYPAEFRDVQAHYPIVFQKTEDGLGFQALALFGFERGENLFLDDRGWHAAYVPLAIQREPFLIGRGGETPTVHVDLDSPRLSRDEGEPLFRPHGGTSEYLERMSALLGTLHEGMQAMPAFADALLKHELLESFVFDVELDSGAQHRLAGYYTIHEERLAALDGAALEGLQRAGHLLPIYMVVASLSRLRDLVERRQERP
jgi:hypothetical protein